MMEACVSHWRAREFKLKWIRFPLRCMMIGQKKCKDVSWREIVNVKKIHDTYVYNNNILVFHVFGSNLISLHDVLWLSVHSLELICHCITLNTFLKFFILIFLFICIILVYNKIILLCNIENDHRNP